MAKVPVSFSRIISGIADYNKESVFTDSVSFIRCIDYRSDPRRWTLLPKAQKESGTVITDLPMWGERISDDTYIYGNAGNIYKRTINGLVTLEHVVSGSSGNGLKYYGEDDFLYYTNDTVIGRYGLISGTPVWIDDFLGAQGGVPLNTYSLDLEAASSQYATAADSATLSQTSDITLEANVKPESLPAAGAEMVVISKWNENGNQRSYKMTVYGVSGYFGDGSDGALTISSNTTETPIDSNAAGTSGAYTLTATNASFAVDQVVLIKQVRGTGAGTWQRNKISSYTAGTITLQNALNFSYSSTGSSKAQVRVLKQYTNVTINAGITYTVKAWDGTVGGILAFLANGTLTLNGTISGNGKGFVGGGGGLSSTGYQGEGTGGDGTTTYTANGSGGGAGTQDGGNKAGGGGGGGNSAVGANGTRTSGTVEFGRGGDSSGSADLTTATFGGAGGGGARGAGVTGTPGSGGNGGGFLFLTAVTITMGASGLLTVNGSNGSAGTEEGAGGGGGAGGSILLKFQTGTLGTNQITATAGTGGSAPRTNAGNGGNGTAGRIHIDYYTSYTGTSNPTLSVSQDASLVTNVVYHLRLYVSSTGANEEIYTKEMVSYTTGVWEHLAVAWDASASTAYFYENANLLGQAIGALTAIYNSTALMGIGADFNSSGTARGFFDGLVDNPRIWSDIRTSTEISNYKLAEAAGTEAGLAAGYQLDNSALDDTVNNNDLTLVNAPVYSTTVPFAAPTTRQDKDQEDTSTGSTAITATTISETATNRQSFVPAKDPQKSISIFISDTGDDPDWTVTVHDAQNRTIATKTIAFANMSTGEMEFTFATPWRPVIGATYHFHVTTSTVTGAPAVVSGSLNNFETAQFVSYFQFLVTDVDYHPIEQVANLLGIGNGRYLATWDAATYSPHKLTFPSGWRVRCLALWREYMAIGCWKGDAIDEYDQGIIFFWDGISDTYNFYINVPEGGINAMVGSQGTLYIIAGYNGDLLEYTGGDKAVKVKRLSRMNVGEIIEVHPGAISMWQTMVRIGVGSTDSATTEQGVYTWGSLNRNYPNSLSYDYRISTNNNQASNIVLGLVLPVGNKLLIGWKDNLSYGLDSVNPASTTYGDGSIEFMIKDEGGVWKEKKLDLVRVDFEGLAASGHEIGLQYKLDRNSLWSAETTESDSGETKLRLQMPNSRHKEYQIKLNVESTTTTSPAILGVTALEDTLEGEQYV